MADRFRGMGVQTVVEILAALGVLLSDSCKDDPQKLKEIGHYAENQKWHTFKAEQHCKKAAIQADLGE